MIGVVMMLDVTFEEMGMLRAGLAAWRNELLQYAGSDYDPVAADKACEALALHERLVRVELDELDANR